MSAQFTLCRVLPFIAGKSGTNKILFLKCPIPSIPIIIVKKREYLFTRIFKKKKNETADSCFRKRPQRYAGPVFSWEIPVKILC
jgi:hypothetical protein